jgi:hypothetical protein
LPVSIPKIPIWDILVGLGMKTVGLFYSPFEYPTFGILYRHFAILWSFGTVFQRFGMLYQDKSGNPARHEKQRKFWRRPSGVDVMITIFCNFCNHNIGHQVALLIIGESAHLHRLPVVRLLASGDLDKVQLPLNHNQRLWPKYVHIPVML